MIPIQIDRARMPDEAALPPSLSRLAFLNAIDVDQGGTSTSTSTASFEESNFSLSEGSPTLRVHRVNRERDSVTSSEWM